MKNKEDFLQIYSNIYPEDIPSVLNENLISLIRSSYTSTTQIVEIVKPEDFNTQFYIIYAMLEPEYDIFEYLFRYTKISDIDKFYNIFIDSITGYSLDSGQLYSQFDKFHFMILETLFNKGIVPTNKIIRDSLLKSILYSFSVSYTKPSFSIEDYNIKTNVFKFVAKYNLREINDLEEDAYDYSNLNAMMYLIIQYTLKPNIEQILEILESTTNISWNTITFLNLNVRLSD